MLYSRCSNSINQVDEVITLVKYSRRMFLTRVVTTLTVIIVTIVTAVVLCRTLNGQYNIIGDTQK
jgi:hypothetical protein